VRRIAVVTVGRSDYGIYRPVLQELSGSPGVTLRLLVGGAHLSPFHGGTIAEVREDGYGEIEPVHMLVASDSAEGVAKSVGLGVTSFAQSMSRSRPDVVVVLGDRYEMFSAAIAALPLLIPVAHLHGGEVTAGAFDDAMRHAMTKLSHLHFVSTEEYRRRVIQLGEEPWRVTVSGAPSLDTFLHQPLMSKEDMLQKFQVDLDRPFLLVTYHPTTLMPQGLELETTALLEALADRSLPVVFTMPNADPGGSHVRRAMAEYATRHAAVLVESFGARAYPTVLANAAAMVGNSSSGIVEAASFKTPVVNIGERQAGRIRSTNVIDVASTREAISEGIRRALSPRFRESLQGLRNPYGDGHAATRIADVLRGIDINPKLLQKTFVDVGRATP